MVTGHVEWRNGRPSFLVDFGYRPDGSRDRQRFCPRRLGIPTPKSEKQAQMTLRKILSQIDEGTWVRPSPATYGEWLLEWIAATADALILDSDGTLSTKTLADLRVTRRRLAACIISSWAACARPRSSCWCWYPSRLT